MKGLNNMVAGVAMGFVLGISSTALGAAEPFIGEIMMNGANFCP